MTYVSRVEAPRRRIGKQAVRTLMVASLSVLALLLATAAPGLAHDPEPTDDPPPEHVPGPEMNGYAVRPGEDIPVDFWGNSRRARLYGIHYSDRGAGEYRIGEVGFESVTGLTFGPDGTLYGIDTSSNTLITIDTSTGAGTSVGSLGVYVPWTAGLTFDCDGNLWMATGRTVGWEQGPSDDPTFYSVDPGSGAATEVGPQGHDVGGLAAKGNTVFGTTRNDGLLVTIDTSTGATTEVGPLTDTEYGTGLSFSPDGSLWGIGGGHIFTVDTKTGSAAQHAAMSGFWSLAIPGGPVCSEEASAPGSTGEASSGSGGAALREAGPQTRTRAAPQADGPARGPAPVPGPSEDGTVADHAPAVEGDGAAVEPDDRALTATGQLSEEPATAGWPTARIATLVLAALAVIGTSWSKLTRSRS